MLPMFPQCPHCPSLYVPHYSMSLHVPTFPQCSPCSSKFPYPLSLLVPPCPPCSSHPKSPSIPMSLHVLTRLPVPPHPLGHCVSPHPHIPLSSCPPYTHVLQSPNVPVPIMSPVPPSSPCPISPRPHIPISPSHPPCVLQCLCPLTRRPSALSSRCSKMCGAPRGAPPRPPTSCLSTAPLSVKWAVGPWGRWHSTSPSGNSGVSEGPHSITMPTPLVLHTSPMLHPFTLANPFPISPTPQGTSFPLPLASPFPSPTLAPQHNFPQHRAPPVPPPHLTRLSTGLMHHQQVSDASRPARIHQGPYLCPAPVQPPCPWDHQAQLLRVRQVKKQMPTTSTMPTNAPPTPMSSSPILVWIQAHREHHSSSIHPLYIPL